MAIERELLAENGTQPSTHTPSYPALNIPQNIEPEVLAFIEKQQTVINACMVQVSRYDDIYENMT